MLQNMHLKCIKIFFISLSINYSKWVIRRLQFIFRPCCKLSPKVLSKYKMLNYTENKLKNVYFL